MQRKDRLKSMIKITPMYGSGILEENAYIITDEESGCSAVVDPSFNNPVAVAEEFHITHILLTHGHFDHIAAAEELRRLTGAKIYIHEADFELAQTSALNLCFMAGLPISVEADEKTADGTSIFLGHSVITVLHTPGHTAGSCCYICGDSMFSGDTLFNGSVGRLDFPTGSESDMRESLKKLYHINGDYTLYPGHDTPGTLKAEKARNPYFEFLRKRN